MRNQLGRLVLILGCAYEIVALLSTIPTITAIIKGIGKHPLGRLAVWSWCGYICAHFLLEDS